MAEFSGRDAAFSGLRLLRREPRLLWSVALVYVLSFLLPQIPPYLAVWPEVVTAVEAASKAIQAGAGEEARNIPQMEQLQARMLPYQLLAFPVSIAGSVVMYGAIYRAILEPGARAFGYLRVGRQEGAMLLTSLVAIFLLIVAAVAAALVIAIFTTAARMVTSDAGLIGVLTFGLILVVVILFGWVGIRLSFALPMSFSESRFRFFESWPLTRGHGWKIFGVQAAMVALVIGISLAIALILFLLVIVVAIAAGLGGLGEPDAINQSMPALGVWLPWLAAAYLAFSLVGSVLSAAMYVVIIAPLGDIYRQLTAEAGETA